jgi:hypothetical protein
MKCSLCPKAPQGLVIPAYVFFSTQNPLYFIKQIRDRLRSVSAVYNQIHVSRMSDLLRLFENYEPILIWIYSLSLPGMHI